MNIAQRDLVNSTFDDVFDAFDYAGAATRLGWPVVFVGRCDAMTPMWLVWVSYPSSISADHARAMINAEKVNR